MKKALLILGLTAATCAVQAQVNSVKNNLGDVTTGAVVSATSVAISDAAPAKTTTGTRTSTGTKRSKRGTVSYNFVKIGNTRYDLQTNASMGSRIVLHDDGTITAVWTTSTDDGTFNSRGTGYNYHNGTEWYSVASPTPRAENVRTGWPSIGLLPNGKQYVIAHEANSGGFIRSTNATKGSQTWTTGGYLLQETNRRPTWCRTANNGNIVHLIASYADSAQPGEKRAPTIKGILAPMTYSRSLDGGVTWDIKHILLPGYDSTRYNSGGGDQYAIDVRDSIVAIITGDFLEDVAIWKSTDNGASFTKIIADSFKYAPYNAKKMMADSPFVSDGTYDVLIDPSGKVHAFWGVTRVWDTDTTNETFSFAPATAGLAYWNEVAKTKMYIASGAEFNRDDSAGLQLEQGTIDALSNKAIPNRNPRIYGVARLGNTAALHMPSASIDNSGNIFVSFSLPMEYDIDESHVLNYRDICIVHSTDGGANWAKAQDVTQWQQSEEEFASIARKSNGFVHMIFQRDEIPGTNLQNNSEADNNHPIPDAGNDIYYAAIPVSEIINGNIGMMNGVGVEEVNAESKLFIVSQNRPNPFSNSSEVLIWLTQDANVTLEVSNIMGQVLQSTSYEQMQKGNQALTINADGLTPGVYFYTLKAGKQSITRKMIVE